MRALKAAWPAAIAARASSAVSCIAALRACGEPATDASPSPSIAPSDWSTTQESAVFALGNACERMLRVPRPSRSRAAKSSLGTAGMWHWLQVVAAFSG